MGKLWNVITTPLRYNFLDITSFIHSEVIKIYRKSSFSWDFNRRKTPPFLYFVWEWTLRSRIRFFQRDSKVPKQSKFTQDEPLLVINEVPHLNDQTYWASQGVFVIPLTVGSNFTLLSLNGFALDSRLKGHLQGKIAFKRGGPLNGENKSTKLGSFSR